MSNDTVPSCTAMKVQDMNVKTAEQCLLGAGHVGGHSFGSDARIFLNEFTEVWSDIAVDLQMTMLDMDRTVGKRVNAYVLELFRAADEDADAVLQNLMSGMLWMFMAGREHAARGYDSPVAKIDRDGDGWVPDTLEGVFGDAA